MMPANSTGPRTADTQNHFVRTRSTNSRRMTAQTLCMAFPVTSVAAAALPASGRRGRRGLRTDEVHENLVERRTPQLEPREARTGRDPRPQDLLGVGAPRPLQLGLLADVLAFRHQSLV